KEARWTTAPPGSIWRARSTGWSWSTRTAATAKSGATHTARRGSRRSSDGCSSCAWRGSRSNSPTASSSTGCLTPASPSCPSAPSSLDRHPSPADARSLGEKRLAGILARNGYCGRKTPAELLARLRSAPEGRAGEAEQEARRAVVLALVATLKPLVEQIKLL